MNVFIIMGPLINWMKLGMLRGFLTRALQNHEMDDPLCEEFGS